MTKNINYVSHKKSKVKNNGKPQLPAPSVLVEGEIAINYAEDVETLSIKNENGNITTFSSDGYYTEQKLGSGFTGSNSATTVTDVLEDCAYIGDDDGSATISDFDPQADTVWKKPQILSSAEKVQVQQNIGVREWLSNLTGENFASYAATSATTAVTQVLPSPGSTDTVYRVGMWDGTQYNPEYYSDYAWDGSAYVQLNKKSIVGEVFDITEYNAGQTYSGLTEALDDVPQSVQKGGMSVKYVQSSDNKYVQFRLMLSTFTDAQFATASNWQGIDDVPTAGSENLIKSGGVSHALSGIDLNGEFDVQSAGSFSIGNCLIEAGDHIEVEVSGTSNVARFWIANQNNERVKDYQKHDTFYTYHNFIAAGKITALSIYVYTLTTAGTFNITLKKNGIKQDVQVLQSENCIIRTELAVSTKTRRLFDNLDIKQGESFCLSFNSDDSLSRIIIIDGSDRILDVNPVVKNKLYIIEATDDITVLSIYSSVSADIQASLYIKEIAELEIKGEQINSIPILVNNSNGFTKTTSLTFTANGIQTAFDDILIPNGYRYQIKISSVTNWTRLAILDQNDWGASSNQHDINNGELYQFVANGDISQLRIFSINSTYPMSISVELMLIGNTMEYLDIPQMCLANKLYVLSGYQNSIYYKNILNYMLPKFTLKNRSVAWKYEDRCCRNNGAQAGFNLQLCDTASLLQVRSISCGTVIGNPSTDNGAKKINVIGDSFTYNGRWYQQIYDLCPNLSFVGMRKSYGTSEPLRAEGRGGWKLSDYVTKPHFDTVEYGFSPFLHPSGYKYYGVTGFWKKIVNGTIGPDTYTMNGYGDYVSWFDSNGYKLNPQANDMMYDFENSQYIYYNGSEWVAYSGTPTFVFDYAKYIEVWEIETPNFVLIMLGVNDFFGKYDETIATAFLANYNTMLDSITAFATANNISIVVGICTNTVIASMPNSNYFENHLINSRSLWNGRKLIIDSFNIPAYENRNIFVVDTGATLDPDYGFDVEEKKPFEWYEGDERILFGTNGVHPSTGGYKQLGTCAAGFVQAKR